MAGLLSSFENPCNLDDSSYELIQEPTLYTSDDEAYTESLISTDDNTAEDLSDEGTERANTDQDDGIFLHSRSESTKTKTRHSIHGCDPHSPSQEVSIKATGHTFNAEPSHQDKPTLFDVEGALFCRSLVKRIEPEYFDKSLKNSAIDKVNIFITQRISENFLSLKRPYRVLMFGDPSDLIQEKIITKLASALAVNASDKLREIDGKLRPIRFNIIPVSNFGSRLSPEVELIESSGIEFTLEKCTGIKPHIDANLRSRVGYTIDVNERPSIRILDSKIVDAGTDSASVKFLPDLFFFCHSNVEDPNTKSTEALSHYDLLCVRSLAISQGLPILDVAAEIPNLKGDRLCFMPTESLHLRIEGSSHDISFSKLLNAVPIPLDLFLSLDSVYLNRHLAFLSSDIEQQYPKKSSHSLDRLAMVANFPRNPPELSKGRSRVFRSLYSWQSIRYFIGIVLLLLFYVFWTNTNRYPLNDTNFESTGSTNTYPSLNPSVSQLVHEMTLSRNSMQASKSIYPTKEIPQYSTKKSLQVHAAKSSYISSATHFSLVRGTKDNELIFKPPKSFLAQKNRERISAETRRNLRLAKCNVTKISDGLFLVEIDRKMAYGTLNVTLWTETPPFFKVSQTVDFGCYWHNILNWPAAMKNSGSTVADKFYRSQRWLSSAVPPLKESLGSWANIANLYSDVQIFKYIKTRGDFPERKQCERHFQNIFSCTKQMVALRRKSSKMLAVEGARLRNSLVEKFSSVNLSLSHSRDKLKVKLVSVSSSISNRARRNAIRAWRKVSGSADMRGNTVY